MQYRVKNIRGVCNLSENPIRGQLPVVKMQ